MKRKILSHKIDFQLKINNPDILNDIPDKKLNNPDNF